MIVKMMGRMIVIQTSTYGQILPHQGMPWTSIEDLDITIIYYLFNNHGYSAEEYGEEIYENQMNDFLLLADIKSYIVQP